MFLGFVFSKLKDQTEYRNTMLSVKKFLLRPEEAQFFVMSPADAGGHRRVKLNIAALIPKPSTELKLFLPSVQWGDDPSNPSKAAAQGNDEADETIIPMTAPPPAAIVGPASARSLLNPEPRVVLKQELVLTKP